MTNVERSKIRAEQLMMSKEVTNAFVELNDYLGDMVGKCPSCGEQVSRYESDRVTHARTCKQLISDSNEVK